MSTPLSEKIVLITGATSGIGYEAAKSIAAMRDPGGTVGPRVVVVGRSVEKTARCLDEIRAAGGEGARVESLLCDFESQASIRALAAAFRERYDRIDILLNNAGTVYDKRKLTVDGYEATFAVNHLGYFLLTNLLLDLVERAGKDGGARIVNVSSRGHRQGTMDFADLHFERGYQIMRAYCRSKLGNVLFTRELSRRLRASDPACKVTVTCLHPGGVATGIWDHAPGWAQPILWLPKKLFFISQAEGGETLVHAATDPSLEGVTAVYFEKKTVSKPSALALDDALAAKLWDVSATLTGLS